MTAAIGARLLAGVSLAIALLGAPGVQMGFNEGVAWTHTFSRGHRFTLARLPGQAGPLGDDDPDRIRIETALGRLSPRLDLPPTAPPV